MVDLARPQGSCRLLLVIRIEHLSAEISTLAIALVASLLACGAPNDASNDRFRRTRPMRIADYRRGRVQRRDRHRWRGQRSHWRCPTVTVTVEVKAITTSAATRYEGGVCSDFKNGVRIECRAQPRRMAASRPRPSALARLDRRRDEEPTAPAAAVKGMNMSEVAGSCPVRSLKLGGIKITTTAAPRYEGGACAGLNNGVLIRPRERCRQTEGSWRRGSGLRRPRGSRRPRRNIQPSRPPPRWKAR